MSKLQLILLGRFDCLLATGTRISLAMRKAEALLAFLALAPGLRHPRERLINLLWSDRGEEQARNSLRQALSSIRKSLGDLADLILQIDRTTVTLNAALVEVDALEFERLALAGDYESLASAADLYQGEFLEGMAIRDAACEEWLDGERQRFKRQYVEILFNLAETQLLSHDYAHAIKSAERLVEQDPLVESGWRLLMRSYFENGDRNHALQAFKRCQQVLRAELEVGPERDTVELREQIAGGTSESRLAPAARKSKAPRAATDSDHSIAVLPFDNLSGDPEQEYFSDGITGSIIVNLSLFPGLQVKSRNSSFAFKQQIKSLGEISRELGVDYIVEGSIRRSSDRVRITVQLIDTGSGNQIWGKRYDADLENLFELEEDLSRSIAATVTGQIGSELQRIAIAKGAADLRAYDLLLSGRHHLAQHDRNSVLVAIEEFHQCLSEDPGNALAHADLYYCHDLSVMDHWAEDVERARELATEHILKAVARAPDSAYIQVAYANHLIFTHEFDEAERQLKRVLDNNPNDTEAIAMRAVCLSTRGESADALEQAELALRLDPYHTWARWIRSECHYFCNRFEDCLAGIAEISNPPGFIRIYQVAANVRLGRLANARQSLEEFLRFCEENMPSIPDSIEAWRAYHRHNAPFADPAKNDHIIDCLVEAGLEDRLESGPREKTERDPPSILVLPFSNLSGDPEQEYFSDGITTSIILSLGLFRHFHVKSQNSSFAYKNLAMSPGEIATALDVNYLVEGSVRKSAGKVRISAQLTEAASGNQLWGRQYDAELEDILELEQELSHAIAATVYGRIGHTLQEIAARKTASDLESYDYLLRGLYHFGKFTARDFGLAKREIGRCLGIDPENATAHTNLGMIHLVEVMEGWSSDAAQSEALAGRHLQRAVDADPDSFLAHAYLAEHLYRMGDFDGGEFHADRAIELNPTASEGYTVKADLLGYSGRLDEAIPCADRCLQLDPHSVGAAWAAGGVYQAAGQYQKAIRIYRGISHPPTSVHALTAACFIGLGLQDEARREMKRYREISFEQMSTYPADEPAWREYWRNYSAFMHDQDFDRLFEQLLAAGLCENPTGTADTVPSIAVLPFDNLSGDPEQEHFADGITADIIDTLSKFKHLRTVARYSTLPYKADKPTIGDIADQQGVRYILEGSVRKSGGRVRVNAELIDSRDESIVWSERYDRDLDDLFAVQDDITREIALAMKVQLDDGEMARVRSKGATDIKAWELTMAAVDLQDTYIRQNLLEARALATEATRLDPGYAYAWISLGWTFWQEYYSGCSDSLDASIDEAEKAVRRAREIDPEYSEGYSLSGMIHLMKHEPEAAIRDCLKAVELEPGNAELQGLTAFAYVFAGDYETASRYDRNIRKLCPLRANWYFLIEGQIEVADGNLERAAEIYRQGLEVEPDSPLCRYFLVDLMLQMGDEAGARHYADEIRALDKSASARGIAHTYSGDPALREAFTERLRKFDLI